MLFIRDRRAATEWTIGKLMTIVLAIVLLALIIYGVSIGGISPLVERATGMFDNVLNLFHVGGDGDGGQVPEEYTMNVPVPGVGTGTLTIGKDICEILINDTWHYKLNLDSRKLEKLGWLSRGFALRKDNRIIHDSKETVFYLNMISPTWYAVIQDKPGWWDLNDYLVGYIDSKGIGIKVANVEGEDNKQLARSLMEDYVFIFEDEELEKSEWVDIREKIKQFLKSECI